MDIKMNISMDIIMDMGIIMRNCTSMITIKIITRNAQDKLQQMPFTITSNSQATSRSSFTQTKTSRKN
jgi:hypothetical protein